MTDDSFEVKEGTLAEVLAQFEALRSRRSTQLLRVGALVVGALATGWSAARWNVLHPHLADEWFTPGKLGPDVRGGLVMAMLFAVPAVLALAALVSWFRVLDGRVTNELRRVVEGLQLEGPLSIRVFWGTPTTTSSSSTRVEFVSEDLVVKARLRGQPFALSISDHDSMRVRRSSTSQRSHVTTWHVKVQVGELVREERFEGEVLPVERIVALA